MISDDAAAANASGTIAVDPPVFLHEKEVQEAIRVVTLIAAGRNPFSNQPFEKLRTDQRDSILQALCIVISALAHGAQQTACVTESWAPSGNAAKSPIKRPLDEYLQQVEREAILEALTETKHNRTAAAKLLGITFRALRYRMENLGLEEGSEQE